MAPSLSPLTNPERPVCASTESVDDLEIGRGHVTFLNAVAGGAKGGTFAQRVNPTGGVIDHAIDSIARSRECTCV